jgi:predicted nucleotidyltransferase
MVEMQKIRDLSAQIARAFNPKKIILYGSHAYGNPSTDSDIDMLVVLPFEGKAVRKAIEIRNTVHAELPLDLLVRTPEQLADRIAQNDWFFREIVEKGHTLYEDTHQ